MLAGPVLGGVLLDFSSFGAIFIFGAVALAAGTALFWRNI